MKYLKKFNESFKDDKLNFILDKISEKGMDSLSSSEKFFLNTYNDMDIEENIEDKLLFVVQEYLEKSDIDHISLIEHEILVDSKNNFKHYIESIDEDVALIVIKEVNEKNELIEEVDDYHLPLEELPEEVILHLIYLISKL